MKILMPFIARSGNSIHSDIVSGGIEKFAKNLFDLFPDSIIPVIITAYDRTNRRTKKIFVDAIKKHKPDFIITNDIDGVFLEAQIHANIPTIFIMHEPLCGDIRYLSLYQNLHHFLNRGGHVYFVSENQFNFFNMHIKRVTGSHLKKINGFVNSAFCDGTEDVSLNMQFDVCTIRRTDKMKDPFIVHRKLENTKLKTCVMTTKDNFQSNPLQIKYYNENLKWSEPNFTFRGLTHSETMKNLASSKVFISTMTTESFGITTLEALSIGVPVILFADKSMKHSSEIIPADKSHYRIVHKSITSSDLLKTVSELSELGVTSRKQISQMTKQKHSKEKYKEKFIEIFNKRLKGE
jgi:glycosyltransferase involved in cell wall biosynthesis